MELTQCSFAEAIIKTDKAMWSRVLNGTRHFRYKKAAMVADILGTEAALWQDSGASPLDRRAAFNKFLESGGKKE